MWPARSCEDTHANQAVNHSTSCPAEGNKGDQLFHSATTLQCIWCRQLVYLTQDTWPVSIILQTTNLHDIICSVVFLIGFWLHHSDFLGQRRQFQASSDVTTSDDSLPYKSTLIERVTVTARGGPYTPPQFYVNVLFSAECGVASFVNFLR